MTRALADALGLDGFLLDANGRVIERMRGQNAVAGPEVSGRPFEMVCAEAIGCDRVAEERVRAGLHAVQSGEVPSFSLEYGVRRDGEDAWRSIQIVPVPGTAGRTLVVIRDVSAGRSAELALDRVRKRAEAAMTAARAASRRRKRTIRRLAVQLLCAQQAERRRIGEELHDDVCQRIAALEISVSSLLRKSGGDQSSLEEIRERLSRLGDDVRRLSHDMNPPDVPGAQLVSRLRAHIDELSRLGQLDVRLEIADVPRDLPDDTALCLYRIAQEALRNITRHAQTSTAHIALRSHRGGIALAIGDAGRGFDAIESGRGVGLSTIRHRIERMHGRLEIASAPGAGTRITAWLPCARA